MTRVLKSPYVRLVSEDTVLVRLADRIDPALPGVIHALKDDLDGHFGPLLQDLIPSYTTLMCVFAPGQADMASVRSRVEARTRKLLRNPTLTRAEPGRCHRLPVCYDPELAPDLLSHAAHCGLTAEALVKLHSERSYQVFAIGFSPGFGFLGEVDPRIAGPRHDVPRTRIPAGSVGIAGSQTAVYPKASPGGWQIIGRCPTTLFDPHHLSLLAVGDRVTFYPVSRQQFLDLGGLISDGEPGAEP